MKHTFNVTPNDYARIELGTKSFDIRDTSNNIQKYDTVVLKEWVEGVHTESEDLTFTVGDVYPLNTHKVVFSLISLEEDEVEYEDEVIEC